ncbi:MAG TPA: hypothetical protein VGI75_09175, partial [Pirellulales bacterium]
ITFTPQLAGTYYVTLAVTSQSAQFTANDYLNFPAPSSTGSAPLAGFGSAGLSGSIISGQAFGGQVLALDADGNFIADYSAAVTAVITDDHGHSVTDVSGNFNGGVFTLSPQSITTLSGTPVTYTLSLMSGSVSSQLPLIVHPISRIGAVESTPITATAGRSFSFTVQTEDDRGEFAPNFTGSVRLTYSDAGGIHDMGGGYRAAVNGVITFLGVALPAAGTYQLQAASADGSASGNFIMTVAPGQELSGDYDHNGIVDAADYVVWRMGNGTQSQYDAWRANYGNSTSAGAGSSTNALTNGDGAAASQELPGQPVLIRIEESHSEGLVPVMTDSVSDAASQSCDPSDNNVSSTRKIAQSPFRTIGFEKGLQLAAMRADPISSHARLKKHSSMVVSSVRRDDVLANCTSSGLSDNPSNIETALEMDFLDDAADYSVSELDTAFATFELSGTAVAVSVID